MYTFSPLEENIPIIWGPPETWNISKVPQLIRWTIVGFYMSFWIICWVIIICSTTNWSFPTQSVLTCISPVLSLISVCLNSVFCMDALRLIIVVAFVISQIIKVYYAIFLILFFLEKGGLSYFINYWSFEYFFFFLMLL